MMTTAYTTNSIITSAIMVAIGIFAIAACEELGICQDPHGSQPCDDASLPPQQIRQQGEGSEPIHKPGLPSRREAACTGAKKSPEELPETKDYLEQTLCKIPTGDKYVTVTRDQADAFLRENGRDTANLLAAYRTAREPDFLKEAMRKDPRDPQVAYEACVATDLHLTEQEMRHWLDGFKKSAPDNSLANYLSAQCFFNSGQTDEGVRELSAAAGKMLDEYTVKRVQSDVAVYLAAGYSAARAEYLGVNQILIMDLPPLRRLASQLLDLANARRQAGDFSSALEALVMSTTLGKQLNNAAPGTSTLSMLVGIQIETKALKAMDQVETHGENKQNVQSRVHQLEEQRAHLVLISQQMEKMLPSIPPSDQITYYKRRLTFGAENAYRWLVGKYGSAN